MLQISHSVSFFIAYPLTLMATISESMFGGSSSCASTSSSISTTVANDAINELRRLDEILNAHSVSSSFGSHKKHWSPAKPTLHSTQIDEQSAVLQRSAVSTNNSAVQPPSRSPPRPKRADTRVEPSRNIDVLVESLLQSTTSHRTVVAKSKGHRGGSKAPTVSGAIMKSEKGSNTSAVSSASRPNLSMLDNLHPVQSTLFAGSALYSKSDVQRLQQRIQKSLKSSREVMVMMKRQEDLLEEANRQLSILGRQRQSR